MKHAVLHALDARTGKELYNSGQAIESWVHFSGLAIAGGRVYVVDYGSNVYCFGLSTRSAENAGIDAPAIYKQNCAVCHKADGKGTPGTRTPDFTLKEWQAQHSDEDLIEAIRQGKGVMPPFENKLKPEEIHAAIAEVIRKFAQ